MAGLLCTCSPPRRGRVAHDQIADGALRVAHELNDTPDLELLPDIQKAEPFAGLVVGDEEGNTGKSAPAAGAKGKVTDFLVALKETDAKAGSSVDFSFSFILDFGAYCV